MRSDRRVVRARVAQGRVHGRITACGGSRSPRLAVERGFVDAVEESFERGEVCEADLIYLASPIGGIIDFLRTRLKQIRPGAIVTDAGSFKTEICRVARESLPKGVTFIGGHPMAGGENTGVHYARADLFDRATYALMIGQELMRSSLTASTRSSKRSARGFYLPGPKITTRRSR